MQSFLVHNEIMRDVIAFLEERALSPLSMSIDGNGWVEAQFKNTDRATWDKLERQKKVELHKPVLVVQSTAGQILHVKFRILAHKPRWQRLLQMIS